MGWASMNEDNESRFFNATIIRNEVDKKMNTPKNNPEKGSAITKLKITAINFSIIKTFLSLFRHFRRSILYTAGQRKMLQPSKNF
mgnify:CR=1 FL=1